MIPFSASGSAASRYMLTISMNRFRCLILSTILIGSSVPRVALGQQNSWTIEPGVRVGVITAESSEADIIKLLGKKNVQRSKIGIGEGEEVPGTVIFLTDPMKKLSILWKDAAGRRRPDRIIINGAKTVWRTAEGITLGTSLVAIEKLNGRPFNMFGFDWDYSGTIVDGGGGNLKFLGYDSGSDGIKDRTLLLRMNPASDYSSKISEQESRAVVGEQVVKSDNKAMRKLNPTVYEITVLFP
jgi:hypothetical protein